MNHSEWRLFIGSLPAELLVSKGCTDPAKFKAVCWALALHGDYESGTRIRPSWLTISKEAGVGNKFAYQVRDVLKESGWLVPVKRAEGNIEEYTFADRCVPEDITVWRKRGEQLCPSDPSVVSLDRAVVSLEGADVSLETHNSKDNSNYNRTLDSKDKAESAGASSLSDVSDGVSTSFQQVRTSGVVPSSSFAELPGVGPRPLDNNIGTYREREEERNPMRRDYEHVEREQDWLSENHSEMLRHAEPVLVEEEW